MKNASFYLLLLVLVWAGDRAGGYALERTTLKSQFRYSRLYDGSGKADLLLLGNSRGLCFFQPYIEEITGKSTFNLSYNGLPADAAKVLVLDYLDRYPAPKKLIIDITACDRENDELLAGFLCYSGSSGRLDTLIRSKLAKVWWGGRVSALFRYNNEIFQRALYYRNRSDKDWLLDRSISPNMAEKAAKNSYDLNINPYLLRRLKETVDAARQKGVPVELVISPYFPGFRVKNLDELRQDAESATGLRVHDYRAALGAPEYFGDYMHLNQQGSRAYMDLLKRDGVLE